MTHAQKQATAPRIQRSQHFPLSADSSSAQRLVRAVPPLRRHAMRFRTPGAAGCAVLVLLVCASLLSSFTSVEARGRRHRPFHTAVESQRHNHCPLGCICLIQEHSIHCDNVPDTQITQPLLSNLQSVWLERVPKSIITKVSRTESQLRKLTWKRSGIETIELNAFSEVEHLQRLDLSENQFTILEDGVFNGLENLLELNLSKNSMNELSSGVFRGMSQLASLDLSKNALIIIPFNILSPLKSLVELDLSSNLLLSIQDEFFAFCSGLKFLNLQNNKIQQLAIHSFSGLSKLQNLDISNNSIQVLPRRPFAGLNGLKILRLSHNPIPEVQGDALTGLIELNRFYLSGTGLAIIKKELLKPCAKLEEVDLSYNERLKSLDIYFPSSVKTLQVTGSRLSWLPELKHVENIGLMDNPWECDCRMWWLTRWHSNLRHVSCSSGISLPKALEALNCQPPRMVYSKIESQPKLLGTALLECHIAGSPAPVVQWFSPLGEKPNVNRMSVLEDGNLMIHRVYREDAGVFVCMGTNPLGNVSAEVRLLLDPITIYNVQIYSLIFGAVCAVAFLLITLIVQLVRKIIYRYFYLFIY